MTAHSIAACWAEIVQGAAVQHVGRKMILPGRAKPWWDQELRDAIKDRRWLHDMWAATKESRLWDLYLQQRKHCKTLATRKQRRLRDGRLDTLQQYFRSSQHLFWRQLKELVGGSARKNAKQRVAAAKDSAGQVVTDNSAIARVFRDHQARLALNDATVHAFFEEWRQQVKQQVLQYVSEHDACMACQVPQ